MFEARRATASRTFSRPASVSVAACAAVALLATACDVAQPRIDPFAETAIVDLMWENRSDRRYFITVGDPRENTLSHWFVVEPCQKAGVWGIVVIMPDDIGVGEAGAAAAPSGPIAGGVDSQTLQDYPQWVFSIAQDDPPDDMVGNLVTYGPPDEHIGPFEVEALC